MNKEEKNNGEKSHFWEAMNLAWELGYTIALPIVILGFGGAYADKKFGTTPLFILIGIVVAMVLTSIGIIRKVKKIVK